MIRLLLSAILLLLLASCATEQKTEAVKANDEFTNIKNSDFESVNQVPYAASNDKFDDKISKSDILASESLGKIESEYIEKLTSSGNDLDRATSLCLTGRYKEAMSVFEISLYRYKSHPSYWNQLGNCLLGQGSRGKALLYYNKAIELDKDYVPVLNNFGVLYLREGKDQNALSAFTEAIKRNPKARTPRYNLAELYLKYGLVNRAEPEYVKLYNDNKKDQDVINALGTIQLIKGNWTKAKTFFDFVDDDKKTSARFILNNALALIMIGDKESARDLLNNLTPRDRERYPLYVSKVERLIRN